MLPGAHRVRAKLAGGRVGEYWYAWRGGPRILAVQARSDAELARKVAEATQSALEAFKAFVNPAAPNNFLSGLITRYLESAEYQRLAPRTKRDIRIHLDFVRSELGEMEAKALGADSARGFLISWRDKFKDKPRTADHRLDCLSKVTRWAHDRGEIGRNPLERLPRLYKANRADIIWTMSDLAILFRGQPDTFRSAVLLATLTGLRLGDLVRLSWRDIGKDAINFTTSKTGRTVTIPIRPSLQRLLTAIGRKEIGVVLTNSHGLPWTPGGLQTAMQRAKQGKPTIKNLRHHDLRGTGATWLVRAGLALSDVALVMGWKSDRVANIARRYVTSEEVAKGMLARIEKNKRGRQL